MQTLQQWDTLALRAQYAACVRDAESALVEDRRLLEAFGFPNAAVPRAGSSGSTSSKPCCPADASAAGFHRRYLDRGTLARRILAELGERPRRAEIEQVYARLCDCLQRGELFP